MAHEDWDCSWRIDGNDTIVEVDEGYRRFARENFTPHLAEGTLGHSLWEFISSSELREIFRLMLERLRGGHGPFELRFRCDGPFRKRLLLMRAEHLPGDNGVQFRSRRLREESREDLPLMDPSVSRAIRLPPLKVCSWCNRLETPDGWMEAEEAIEHFGLFEAEGLPPLSHGLDPDCYRGLLEELDTEATGSSRGEGMDHMSL